MGFPNLTINSPCIYSIVCPISGDIIYIGKTLYRKQRISCHLTANFNTPICNYIKYLKSMGLTPVFEDLELFYDGKMEATERQFYNYNSLIWDAEDKWINYYRNLNYIMLNIRKVYTA